MSTVKVVNNVAFVESALTVEQLKNLKKHRPDALKLTCGETKKVVFAVDVGEDGCISDYGAVFANEKADGTAYITIDMGDAEDPKKFIYENFGAGLVKLNKLEQNIAAAAAEVSAEKAQVYDSIVIG